MRVAAPVVAALLSLASAAPSADAATQAQAQAQDTAVGAAVLTSSGIYQGHQAAGFPGVSEYLGIRYAQGTSGSLRFMPPVAFESRSVFKASNYVRIRPR